MHGINSEAELFRTERMREKLDEIKGTHISKNNILGEIISNYELRLEIKKLTMALMIEILKKQNKIDKKHFEGQRLETFKGQRSMHNKHLSKIPLIQLQKTCDFRWKTNGIDNINFSWLMLSVNARKEMC